MQALQKQLEATDSMEEAIQIAKKIRTAKRILFYDERKQVRYDDFSQQPFYTFIQKSGELAADQDTQKHTASVAQADKTDASIGDSEGSSSVAVSDEGTSYLAQGNEDSNKGDTQLLRVESGYESLQGIRKTMEDAHVLLDDLFPSYPQLSSCAHLSAPFSFYAVYDGKPFDTQHYGFVLIWLNRTCWHGGSVGGSRRGPWRGDPGCLLH